MIMIEDLSNIWKQLTQARDRSDAYECRKSMNGPVSPDVIEQQLRRLLDQPIPVELLQSLQIHDGVSEDGCWFPNTFAFYPMSAAQIMRRWQSDRQREAEMKAEDMDWEINRNFIPVIGDYAAHHTYYLDARDGTFVNYIEDGLTIDKFRYPNYQTYLSDVLRTVLADSEYVWPWREDHKKSLWPI